MIRLDKDYCIIEITLGDYKTYVNSPSGRMQLVAEQSPEIVDEVIAVWGDTPTMQDTVPEPIPEPTPTPPDPRDLAIAQLMRDVATLKGGTAHV